MFASILDKGSEVKHQFDSGRKAYIHIVQTGGSVLLNDQVELKGGDGAFITFPKEVKVKGTSEKEAEFVLFDLSSAEPDEF